MKDFIKKFNDIVKKIDDINIEEYENYIEEKYYHHTFECAFNLFKHIVSDMKYDLKDNLKNNNIDLSELKDILSINYVYNDRDYLRNEIPVYITDIDFDENNNSNYNDYLESISFQINENIEDRIAESVYNLYEEKNDIETFEKIRDAAKWDEDPIADIYEKEFGSVEELRETILEMYEEIYDDANEQYIVQAKTIQYELINLLED